MDGISLLHAGNELCDECGDRAVDTPVNQLVFFYWSLLLSARETKRSNPIKKIPALVHFGAWKGKERKWEAPKAETKSHGSKTLI